MQKVHIKGSYNVVARKTGRMLFTNLPVDMEVELNDPYFKAGEPHPIVRRILAETHLRTKLVEEFRNKLRDRKTYLQVGGTQWSIDLAELEYNFEHVHN